MAENKKESSFEKNLNDKSKKRIFTSECVCLKDLLFVVYDIVAVAMAYFLALWFRFDCRFSEIPDYYLMAWLKFTPIYIVISIVVFWLFRLYRSIWKYASFTEIKRIICASGVLMVLHTALITVLFYRMPISYYVIGGIIQFLMIVLVRFTYRFISMEREKNIKLSQALINNRVMLIGAGEAGQMILRDLQSSKRLNENICCIIDDDKKKQGRYLYGVPIVGGREEILLNVEKYNIQKIYLAMPGASVDQRRDILSICKETNCQLKSLPGIAEIVSEINTESMRDVSVEDLLGRESIKVNMDEIHGSIEDKVILVTGGGGSIGSELCRQIAKHNPKKLIVFDIYENNAHAIGLELKDSYPNLDTEVLIGSVRDSRRINQVFAKYKPDIVYHAAAHKHVPLMEDSPCESIKNNAIGTYKTAYAAMVNGCKRFVLISTDKAVNSTNIMGASKRLCEMIIQSFDKKIKEGKMQDITPLNIHFEDAFGSMNNMANIQEQPNIEFVAVRFGNVLGSNGSVVPRFKEQIEKGGPVTVTHPDIIRYFMTIPEAVSLVLQAGTYAKGGEIFVLDMGAPVKIDTLARNLIRLSGFIPDVDIKIEYTGLRAGEKLYEEKLMSEEGLKTTPNHLIHIGSPISFETDKFLEQLTTLMTMAYDGEEDKIRKFVADIVGNYHPAGEHGSDHKGLEYDRQIEIATQNEALVTSSKHD